MNLLRIGGRIYTLREPFSDGMYAEAGAARIPDNHQLTLKYIKLFGLTLDPFEPDNLAQVAYIRGRRIKIPNRAATNKEAKENESDKKNQQ